MIKKLSIMLIITLMVFAFVPALTLAQDEVEDDLATEDEIEKNYQNLEELLLYLEENEDLSSVEKTALERKLTDYDESLNIESMTSVVDKILNEEIDLGQGFVILRNLEDSVANGYEEEKALELINSHQNEENSGQFAFQTALELRKLSREDLSGENTEDFTKEVASIIEENGDIETSELKQLAAEYRKEAREENREEMKANRSEKSNSASEKALENGKENNASEKALNKDNNGKGNSENSKAEDKGKDKGSNKSSKSNSNK